MAQHRKENAKQFAAFELYFTLGEKRSLDRLHKQMSEKCPETVPSTKTLARWSSWFNWQERVQLKDQEVADGVGKRSVRTAIERKAKVLALIDEMINQALDKTGKPILELKTTKDLKDLIETMLKLTGEERQDTEHATIKIIRIKGGEPNDKKQT